MMPIHRDIEWWLKPSQYELILIILSSGYSLCNLTGNHKDQWSKITLFETEKENSYRDENPGFVQCNVKCLQQDCND